MVDPPEGGAAELSPRGHGRSTVVVRMLGCSLLMEGSELRPMEAKVLVLIFTIYCNSPMCVR